MTMDLPHALVFALLLLAACDAPSQPALDHLKRGDAALAAGKYTQAMVAYGRARELAPHEPSVQRALMRGRAYLLADQPGRLGQDGVEEARYDIQVLLETDARHRAAYLTALGQLLAHSGDTEGAKAKYAEALKADPNSALAHTALGVALMKTKEGLGQAKTELDAAIKAEPGHVAALVGLAQAKLADGDLVGAGEKLEAALKIHEDPAGRVLLASVRTQQNKGAEAITELQKAVQLEPKNHDALVGLGQALLAAGKAEEAERPLRVAAQLRPDMVTSMALGYALMRQKKSEAALGLFNQVLAQDPGAVPAMVGAGISCEDLGRQADAATFFKRALAAPPDPRPSQKELRADAQRRLDALAAAEPGNAAPADAGAPKPAKPPRK